jgi:hypothetical protein
VSLYALVALLGSCSPCGVANQEVTSYVVDKTCGATISGSPALMLPSAPTPDCGDCGGGDTCVMTPSTCTSLCVSIGGTNYPRGFSITMQIRLPVPHGDSMSLTLPDPSVTIQAAYFDGSGPPGVAFTVMGGSLKVQLSSNHQTSTYSLALVDAVGEEIDIANGTFALHGHEATACLAN